MGRAKTEEEEFSIDMDELNEVETVAPATPVVTPTKGKVKVADRSKSTDGLINCLSNTTVIVRHLP